VSWYDAVKWCNAKSEMERVVPVYQLKGKTYKSGACSEKGGDTIKQTTSAKGYRLPTDGEWEWAARGGKKSKGYTYSGSNEANAVAWFMGNSGQKLQPTGQKLSNEIGLCDMSGNAWEWCWDLQGSTRLVRGSSFYRPVARCGVADHNNWIPWHTCQRCNEFGFRLARSSGN
jgi:formylglycine-generating enzyme required for sulfatase activity